MQVLLARVKAGWEHELLQTPPRPMGELLFEGT
jgi:hypothetical protein